MLDFAERTGCGICHLGMVVPERDKVIKIHKLTMFFVISHIRHLSSHVVVASIPRPRGGLERILQGKATEEGSDAVSVCFICSLIAIY